MSMDNPEENWFEQQLPSLSLEREYLVKMCNECEIPILLFEEMLDIEHSFTLKSSRSGIIKAMLGIMDSYEKGGM